MRVELWAPYITYRSPNDSECDFPNDKNMNAEEQPVDTWLRRNFTADFPASGNGWVKASTPLWTSYDLGEQDVRARVLEDMRTYNGGVSSVRADNVRVECNTQQSEGDCT